MTIQQQTLSGTPLIKRPFLSRILETGKIIEVLLPPEIKIYTRKIAGFNIFVYNINKLIHPTSKSRTWVCIERSSGVCIDGRTRGHGTRERAFDGAMEWLTKLEYDEMVKIIRELVISNVDVRSIEYDEFINKYGRFK